MPRLPLHRASGTAIITGYRKAIRFARYGCTNRPFYHIVVMDVKNNQLQPPIEQLGTFDPLTNEYNEQLASFNFKRIQYWIGKGALLSEPVAELLGLAGFLPIHPKTFMYAWRNRRKAEENGAQENSTQETSMNSSS